MKKVLFLTAFLGCLIATNAQISFRQFGHDYANGDTIVVEIDDYAIDEALFTTDIDIVNSGSDEIATTASCYAVDAQGIIVSGMCAGQCLDGNVSRQFIIPANGVYDSMTIDFLVTDPSVLTNNKVEMFRMTVDIEGAPCIYIKVVVVRDVSIPTVDALTQFSASPNPAHGQVAISYSHNSANAQVAVYDMLGKCVAMLPATEAQGTVTLNVADWPQGIYLYGLVESSRPTAMKKFAVK